MSDAPSSSDPTKPPVRQRRRRVSPADPANASSPPAVPPRDADGDGYAVGYRKPPKHTQFKAGHDPRRPRGRKAGSKNKANSIIAMMESPTSVRTPEGEVRTISTADALARKLRELALSGQLPAITKAFELYLKVQPAPALSDPKDAAPPESAEEAREADQAILAWYEEEIRTRGAKEKKA